MSVPSEAHSPSAVARTDQALPGEPETRLHHYWRMNLKYLFVLLVVWFAVSYGAAIIFAEQLNRVKLAGFPLGFWFAQQGSIYVFVALIFIYVRLMNKLDRAHGVAED